MHLLAHIELYLQLHSLPATRFGREAVRDPRFVLDLRNGRSPRPPTVERVAAWIARRESDGPCLG